MTNKADPNMPGYQTSAQILNYPKMKEKLGKIIFPKKNIKVRKNSAENFTFQQNLQACHLVDAGKQLISREDRLYVLKQEGIGSQKKQLEEEEDSEAKLEKDYEDWLKLVKETVENSLNFNSAEEHETLKDAVQAVLQEEEQDRRWEGFKKTERPPRRPRCYKKYHDDLLEGLVKSRIQEAQLDSSDEKCSSVQKSISGKAKQLKEDLLKVVTWVSSCYPEQENVCQRYANLYHENFSGELREVAKYGLCDKDCNVLLCLVKVDYPNILNDSRIKEVIDHTQLSPLLPEDILRPLELQFLRILENDLSTCLQKALNSEESAWKKGETPQLTDLKYFCPLHIDVIQLFDGCVTFAQNMLGDSLAMKKITCQMSNFLADYKRFQDKVIKENQANSEAVLMANLLCITHFSDYIKTNNLFPEDVKTNCLSLLNAMRKSIHADFTSNIHKNLKEMYRKLGSAKWFRDSEGLCEELLAKLHTYIQKFNHLEEKCCQELLGDLYKEILAEYVRKMMKNKIRFSNKEKQQKAAEALCKNSDRIHMYLTTAGSNSEWLKDILPKLAELLKLQDPDSIKLELVDLLRDYPDISKRHVIAWLSLKKNLSTSEKREILMSVTFSQNQLREEQDSLQASRSFFSIVKVKWIILYIKVPF